MEKLSIHRLLRQCRQQIMKKTDIHTEKKMNLKDNKDNKTTKTTLMTTL